MKCNNCGQENPRGARYCGYCQQELERKQGGALLKKYGILIVSCVAVLVFVTSFAICKRIYTSDTSHKHTWKNTSCKESMICTICGQKSRLKGAHQMESVTCTLIQTCKVCGVVSGDHRWSVASCMAPKTCEVCGTTSGEKTEHLWSVSTCQVPRTCKICGKTSGSTSSHSWRAATADVPKTCIICGETSGYALSDPRYVPVKYEKEPTVEDVIRERLPIATYAMADAEKVYSYSDATLTEQTKQYYFNSQTDEIVILDISEDGSAMYVRYPSTISGTGYRDCWFAVDDILGGLEVAVSSYLADEKTKAYRRLDDEVATIYYDMIPKGTEGIKLGQHTYYYNLVIHKLTKASTILNVDVKDRMSLVFSDDKPDDCVAGGYKTFLDYLEYGYERPNRVLTKKWADGAIKISFLSQRELYFELTDSYMSEYLSTTDSVPLTNVVFAANQNDLTGFTITLAMLDQLHYEGYFTNTKGKKNLSCSFADVQANYSNECVTVYLALPENMSWNVYDLTSISVKTHLDEAVLEEYVVTEGNRTVEIHEDDIRKIQSEQHYFSALDTQGHVRWRYVTQERQDRGQMSGIKCIGYINDVFLFDDNNTIVALDAETGKELWKKQDFDGVINAWDVSVDGTLFFAGSYAPDLFIVSENGNLLKEVEELDGIDEKHPYVNKIWVYDDYVIVGVNNYWDGWEQKYRVDLDDYSCTLLSDG